MGKKDYMSLFDRYVSSLPSNEDHDDFTPLPDSMRTSTLLEQIGKDRSWTDDQVDSDIAILEKNRLYFVRDLRILSNHSWSVIELLPLVRDLLRQAIVSNKKSEQDMTDDVMDAKAEKKKKKKEKKEKKKKMGEPVVPSLLVRGRDEVALAGNTIQETSSEIMKDVLSEDPETIRNTIRNGSIDLGKDDTPSPVTTNNEHKKSVSFCNENGTIPQQRPSIVDSSDESSSSSSSSSSGEDDQTGGKQQQKQSNSFGLRPIKPVSANRIQIKTSNGQVYECDRFCPHKGVDLSTWGQVLGNNLICTKHNWKFDLSGSGLGNKGRSIHPCKVNDW
ncbi:uncharacterized protein BX664DRAFT_301913 [Halteromyces radiatus]|uniref:uncharacterized protein n=1 Tax=Halteromyces radiatus TaxID=101107 RepID=UPI0022209F30|nr:uncharacterized protein BX664DRAFT_301913 [Halteromyces radiatus]KAI8081298.1 hypothetical protein BX664DRAFT_301913 [Halteromyces radiatus]